MLELTHKTHKMTHEVVFPILTRAAMTSFLRGGKHWLHCFTSQHIVKGVKISKLVSDELGEKLSDDGVIQMAHPICIILLLLLLLNLMSFEINCTNWRKLSLSFLNS